ncbi:YciI family protein [Candidatus Enterococcus moelleringii]|uniref:YciI family protein n=1 Tax=Candidatus Enterococcus moelleringii TaxID=2815325 RepID=UPI001F614D67|nr:YciI family protein [Enterococcus sp. 669A]
MLNEASVLYVRTDYKLDDRVVSEAEAMASMDYLQQTANERYLLAGVFGDMETEEVDRAMILFEAKDLEEAKQISDEDPIIKGGYYRYELKRWNLMVFPANN